MFKTYLARFSLRTFIVAILTALATLKASLGEGVDAGEWIDVVTAFFVGAGLYAGAGAVSSSVEPGIGKGP